MVLLRVVLLTVVWLTVVLLELFPTPCEEWLEFLRHGAFVCMRLSFFRFLLLLGLMHCAATTSGRRCACADGHCARGGGPADPGHAAVWAGDKGGVDVCGVQASPTGGPASAAL